MVERSRPASRRPLATSLRLRLFALVLVALVPAALLLVLHAGYVRTLGKQAIVAETRRLTDLASSEHEGVLRAAGDLLMVLSRTEAVRGSSGECSAFLAELRTDLQLYANLGVADADTGDVVCSALPVTEPVNVSDRDYFREALLRRGVSVGTYQIGRITGRPSLNLGYPIVTRAGDVDAVVFAAVDLEGLSSFAARAQLPANAVLTVFDSDGTILVRRPDGERWVGRAFPDASVITSAINMSQTAEVEGLDGVPRLYAFDRLRGSGDVPAAFLSIGIDEDRAFASADADLRRDLLLMACAILLGLGLAYAGARSIERPVSRLARAAARLKEGDLSARASFESPVREIEQLGTMFDEMAASLEARAAELASSVKRLENLWHVDQAILGAGSAEEIATATFDRLSSLIPFQRASVMLFEPDSEVAHVVAVRDEHGSGPEQGIVPGIGGLSPEEQGFRSVMTFPLRANGRVEGMLEFASVDTDAFTVDHDGIAREVADQLAIAVSQARLRAELIDQARELEERLDDLRRTDRHRRTLLARVVSAQEEERRRIAEDINDDPVQIMTAVGMRLDLLKARLTDDADRAAVTTLAQTVVQAIARLRGLLFELAPQVLERRGVAAAVRNYVDQRMSEGRVQVEVISRLSEEPSYETRVVVYRNIQAALANVRAHSLAAHVRVTIEPREGVLARVEDDGVGFDVGAAPEDELGHLGLMSMRERAELAGGWFRVESERGHGTTVEFWVPELAEPAAVAAT